jgi:hypothetical protein
VKFVAKKGIKENFCHELTRICTNDSKAGKHYTKILDFNSCLFVKFAAKKEVKNGAEAQNRTADTRLFRPLLYQLSYLGDRGLLQQDDKITESGAYCQAIFA